MIQSLLKYQETDAKLRDLELELSKSEERKKAKTAQKYLEGVDESLNKLELKAGELYASFESALKELEILKEKEAEYSATLSDIDGEDEANYLMKKTDELLGKIKALSAEISKLTTEINALSEEYTSVRKTIKMARAQYDEYGLKYNELRKAKKPAMDEIKAELDILKKDIEPEILDKYLKKRADKIFPIVVPLENNVCGGCFTELSMSDISKLKTSGYIECDNCRKIIFIKE